MGVPAGSVQDLLRFYAPVLGEIPEFKGSAFISPYSRETGFIHKSARLHEYLQKKGYEITASSSDMRSGVVTTVCIDPEDHIVERVLGAAFCPSVTVGGMAAFERDGRLEMPRLTKLSKIANDSVGERFPWIPAAITFANRCMQFGDLSVPGIVRYSTSIEVKKAWNEFFRASSFLWVCAPSFDIGWKEELPEDEPAEAEKAPNPLDVIRMMKTHPKNDREIDMSFRHSTMMESFRPAG